MKVTPLSFSGEFTIKGCTQKGDCPSCKQPVEMILAKTALTPKLCHIPTKKLRKSYVAICPNCASKFSLSDRWKSIIDSTDKPTIFISELESFKQNDFLIDLQI